MTRGYCRNCRGPLVSGRRFCGQCGHPSPAEERAHADGLKHRSQAERGAIIATAVVFSGTLIAIVTPVGSFVESEAVLGVLRLVLLVLVAGAGALFLGRAEFKRTWSARAEPRWLGIAFVLGCVGFAISYGYVTGLFRLFGSQELEVIEESPMPLALLVLDVVLITAVIEEWLCRGVLWTALSRISGKWVVIFLTAFLFALLHSFNGLLVFEWPHRFALGLIWGWLRYRSGSLWPGVIAHAVNNALAVWIERV